MIKTKFLITGNLRSGTTFLSTLINSQDDACCFEIALNNIQDIKDENDNISFITNEDNELRKLYFTFIYNFSKEYNN